jgi:hypothetical protein
LKQANKKSKILHFSYSKSRSFNTNWYERKSA